MAFDDSTCSKDFTISDKRMIISILLNQPDQTEITKIMKTGKYNTDDTQLTLDWYGNIHNNGKTMSTKTVKAEFICNLEKTIKNMNDVKNGTDKQSQRKMNSLHYCTLIRTVGKKLQKILSLMNLHEIELNFSWFNYKLYQNTEHSELYIIEKSYKMFGYNLIIPEHIIIFDNYLCIDHRNESFYI
jgi:hypothetical protein